MKRIFPSIWGRPTASKRSASIAAARARAAGTAVTGSSRISTTPTRMSAARRRAETITARGTRPAPWTPPPAPTGGAISWSKSRTSVPKTASTEVQEQCECFYVMLSKVILYLADGIETPIPSHSKDYEHGLGRDPSHSASNETFCRCHNRGRSCYCDTRQVPRTQNSGTFR